MTSTLWRHWYQAIAALRPAFARQQTFLWFVVCVAGMSVRSDNLGVSSIVRALALKGRCYSNLRRCYHSAGIKLERLSALWTRLVLRLFGEKIARVNGRPVLLVDGKKNAKAGKKSPRSSIDVVKGFVTPQLSRFLRLRQLLLIIIGAHVTQV
jgi:hypothetical protein